MKDLVQKKQKQYIVRKLHRGQLVTVRKWYDGKVWHEEIIEWKA